MPVQKKLRNWLGVLTKPPDSYPARGNLAGFIAPYLGMWSDRSVPWQLSHKSPLSSSSQLLIVTDDHKRLHQSASCSLGEPLGQMWPVLFPSHYSQSRRRIPELRQKDEEQHFSLACIHTMSESLKPHRLSLQQGQAGLGSGFWEKRTGDLLHCTGDRKSVV